MTKKLKYGEETVMVNFRVPKSKESEIKQIVKLKLNEYEKEALTKESVVVDNGIPKWKIEAEKKSNPADYSNVKEARKSSDLLSTPIYSKDGYEGEIHELIAPEISKFEKAIESVAEKPKAKKVDMDALRKIAAGEGVKGTFSLTKKKVNIDEEYEFEYVKSIPDQDDQIVIDKKGLAFYSKYDLGVFYVKWEGKYMRFDSKAEFDRFGKEYLTLI